MNKIIPFVQNEVYIKKANSLVQLCRYIENDAGTAPSLLAKKILVFALGLHGQDCDDFHTIEFSVREFWKACGKDGFSSSYKKDFASAAMELKRRGGWMLVVNPETGEEEIKAVSFFSDITFSKNGNVCKMTFDRNVAPVLINLKKDYFTYRQAEVLHLESSYGFELFELLHSYKHLNTPFMFTFTELATLLDATNYQRGFDFKRRVIDAAVNDINKHCKDISVSYEIKKTGRFMTDAVFTPRFTDTASILKIETSSEEYQRINNAEQTVKKQISYNALCNDAQQKNPDSIPTINLIVEIMVEVLTTSQKTFTINGNKNFPTYKLQERYKELNEIHINWVLHTITHNTKSEIKSPRAYIRTVLYNAPLTTEVQQTSGANAARKEIVAELQTQHKRDLDYEELSAIHRMMNEPDTEELSELP